MTKRAYAYISDEYAEQVKQVAEDYERSESWVLGMALTIFLTERGPKSGRYRPPSKEQMSAFHGKPKAR